MGWATGVCSAALVAAYGGERAVKAGRFGLAWLGVWGSSALFAFAAFLFCRATDGLALSSIQATGVGVGVFVAVVLIGKIYTDGEQKKPEHRKGELDSLWRAGQALANGSYRKGPFPLYVENDLERWITAVDRYFRWLGGDFFSRSESNDIRGEIEKTNPPLSAEQNRLGNRVGRKLAYLKVFEQECESVPTHDTRFTFYHR
jgi:hypothetical protein